VLGGVLAVIVCAYLAAVYLTWDARRFGDPEMAEYFRRRAVGAAVVAGVGAVVGIFVLRADARYIFDGLTSRALVFVIVSALSGSASLVLLMRNAARGARLLAVVAVASIVIGWGVAQWPYILPTTLKVSDAAAPTGTLATLVVATILLLVIVVPGFILLYTLDQRSLLPEEGADAQLAATAAEAPVSGP
jgi:cytochrome d ubiquinol oxidase subunit II